MSFPGPLGDRAAAVEIQSWEFLVGRIPVAQVSPLASLPQGAHSAAADVAAGHVHTLSVPVASSLPCTIDDANLHRQTNDSDGGGDVSTCVDAQAPQSGAYGPADAYADAKTAGLDILGTSEHDHLFDGSTGTNANGDASAAMFGWDYNSSNPLFGDVYTAKSDYAAIYATMRQRGGRPHRGGVL